MCNQKNAHRVNLLSLIICSLFYFGVLIFMNLPLAYVNKTFRYELGCYFGDRLQLSVNGYGRSQFLINWPSIYYKDGERLGYVLFKCNSTLLIYVTENHRNGSKGLAVYEEDNHI